MKRAIFFTVTLFLLSNTAAAKELYRVPSSGDKGTYYVLESKKLNDRNWHVLTSRVGKGDAYTDFTELEINCKTKQYLVIAGGEEDGAKDKPTKRLNDWSSDSKWTSLVIGSSKYDLVEYLCNKNRKHSHNQ